MEEKEKEWKRKEKALNRWVYLTKIEGKVLRDLLYTYTQDRNLEQLKVGDYELYDKYVLYEKVGRHFLDKIENIHK